MGPIFLVMLSLFGSPAGEATTLTIQGMTCGGCAAAIRLQLRRTEGVIAAEVSYEEKRAVVTFDPERTSPDRIVASIERNGYSAQVYDADLAGAELGDAACTPRTGCAELPEPPSVDAEAAGLASLSHGLEPLVTAFNEASNRPRFLAILSPTCPACVHGARAIRKAIADNDLEVFVVWAPMLGSDSAAAASRISPSLGVPGARQFWDPERRVGTALRRDQLPDAIPTMISSLPPDHFLADYLEEQPADRPEWDIYLLFDRGDLWGDDVPKPARWVRQAALYPVGDDSISLLWRDAYSHPPVEGRLTEALRTMIEAETRR